MKSIYRIILILLILWPVCVFSQQIPQNPHSPQKQEPIHETGKQENNEIKENPGDKTTVIHEREGAEATPGKNSVPQASNRKNEENWMNKLLEDPTALFTAGLFLVTVGLLLANWRLVANSKKASVQQLRAYVFTSLSDGEKMFRNENECLSAPLIVKNYGQTPAYKLKCNVFIGLYRNPLSGPLDPPSYDSGSIGSLASNQTVRQYPTLPRPLTIPERNKILDSTHGIYVWGYLEYRDIFKTYQTAQFRMISTGDDFVRGELAYCEEGNEAT